MSVLGYSQPRNPKSITQLDATCPQRTRLIGICKDIISRMDPLREAGLQGLAVETTLATRKHSSSIFYWRTLHNFQEGKSYINENTNCEPWLQWNGASDETSCPPLIVEWASLDNDT